MGTNTVIMTRNNLMKVSLIIVTNMTWTMCMEYMQTQVSPPATYLSILSISIYTAVMTM